MNMYKKAIEEKYTEDISNFFVLKSSVYSYILKRVNQPFVSKYIA